MIFVQTLQPQQLQPRQHQSLQPRVQRLVRQLQQLRRLLGRVTIISFS